jgi:hypothetical protein
VQSQVRLNGSGEGSRQGLGGFGESQVKLNRICSLSIQGNQAAVYRALRRSTLQKDLKKYNLSAVGDTTETYFN